MPVELLEEGAGPLAETGLRDGELHLWQLLPDPGADLGPLERLVQPDELERSRAMPLERRREFLLTRALVRTVLSAYSPTPPSAWRFRSNPHGRPELDPPSPLRFNLSNCEGLVACVVALEREVGLDVEPAGRGPAVLDLAARVFSPVEQQALSALASLEARCDLALTLWTLKEAYLKARGVGLLLPLPSFSFSVGAGGISLQAPPDVDAAPDGWTFASFEVGAHRVAVATGRGPGRPPRLRLWRTSPTELSGPGATATSVHSGSQDILRDRGQ